MESIPFVFYVPKTLVKTALYYCISVYNSEHVSVECTNLIDTYGKNFYCKNLQLIKIKESYADTKSMLGIMMILIAFFSSIIIMVTMIFNVKERFYEIAIKRAIGASKSEIMFLFLVEALMYSVIGLLIGVIIGTIAGFLIQSFLSNYNGFFNMVVSLDCYLIPCAVIPVCTMVFSLIPAGIAASMNISLTLKVE
jgi:ABC-type antimicrobial peptide transport system permease subunit